MSSAYADTYKVATDNFIDAAPRAGALVERVDHPEKGAEGEALSTHFAWIGHKDAENVIVTVSATHGVEGFFGSAVQTEWLRRAEAEHLSPNTASLLIHAINPYGFSWLRRVNEDNVDLNRNWVDFSEQLPSNLGYASLAEKLCPTVWTVDVQHETSAWISDWCAQSGIKAFQEALSAGQWEYPKGLFFGGKAASWSRKTMTEIVQSRLGQSKRAIFLDFHTGLGPYGYVEPIIHSRMSDPAFSRARRWLGAAAKSLYGGNAISVEVSGDGMSAMQRLLPDAVVDAISLECGLQTLDKVAHALRADAWLHNYGNLRSPMAKEIKTQIRNAFHSDDPFWQGMALGQGLAAWRAAMGELKN